jgi:hypothetical protein
MIQKYNDRQTAGFTIVELMIAMAFISVLLLAIAMVVMQIGAIYNKGTTMKSVNQSGRAIVDDMKRTIGASKLNISTDYKAHDHNEGSRPTVDIDSGRLCTGTYSYIWNIGTHVDPAHPELQFNKYSGDSSDKLLRLVRVLDSGRQYCKGDAKAAIDPTNAVELLSDGDLAVQGFHIEQLTNNSASGMVLYNIGITISNADREAINTVDNSCQTPDVDATFQNYCAVNEFIFTARAGNKGGN